jgi:hypothetical protein
MTAVSPSTWLARLWQEAAQIFDKWSVDGAKGEHDGPAAEHPDVQAVAAQLAETKPPDITADQAAIADHISQVVFGMQSHAAMLISKPGADDAFEGKAADDPGADPGKDQGDPSSDKIKPNKKPKPEND